MKVAVKTTVEHEATNGSVQVADDINEEPSPTCPEFHGEQSLRRMREFKDRKERFVAAVRTSED